MIHSLARPACESAREIDSFNKEQRYYSQPVLAFDILPVEVQIESLGFVRNAIVVSSIAVCILRLRNRWLFRITVGTFASNLVL